MLISLKIDKPYKYYIDNNKEYDVFDNNSLIFSDEIKDIWRDSYSLLSVNKSIKSIENQDIIINQHYDGYKLYLFKELIELDNNIVVKFVNNINDNRAIDLIGQLSTIYNDVTLCTTNVNSPLYNIHYLICKNKKDNCKITIQDYSILSINENIKDIYIYLYTYYSLISTRDYLHRYNNIFNISKKL